MRSRRWLTLGIGVKRYLLLIFLGTVILALALAMFLAFVYRTIDVPGPAGTIVYYITLQFLDHPVREITVGILGLLAVVVGATLLGRTVLSVMVDPKDDLAEALYQNRRLQSGPRMVAIGGGTGLGVLLRGLKKHTNNITAVVTVSDDGGSSGKLREDFNLLPPGDVRQCLTALADSESLMHDIMEYRFTKGQGLQGHSLGNLLIAAMADLNDGNFERGVNAISEVLRVRGRILPSTLSHVKLAAEMTDGSIIRGESRIRSAGKPIQRVFIEPRHASANGEAIKEILAADIIILGPGSVFTSVIPNLLVPDIATAIRASGALKIYVCNVATEPGETDGYDPSDHVSSVTQHVGSGLFQYTLANSNTRVGLQTSGGARIVEFDPSVQLELLDAGVQPVMADVIDPEDSRHHDPDMLASAIMNMYAQASKGQPPIPIAVGASR